MISVKDKSKKGNLINGNKKNSENTLYSPPSA